MFISRASVQRLTMRNDHELERKVEQRSQGRQRSLVMPRCGPHTELASRGRKLIGEHESALLGQPQRCLVATSTVVERNDPSRKLTPGIDPLSNSVSGMSWRKKSLGPNARA
jgi:hypothetical protein